MDPFLKECLERALQKNSDTTFQNVIREHQEHYFGIAHLSSGFDTKSQSQSNQITLNAPNRQQQRRQEKLCPIFVEHLRPQKKHTHRILYGNLCVDAFEMKRIYTVLRDDRCDVIRLSVRSPFADTKPGIHRAECCFPKGIRIAIIEPHYVTFSDENDGIIVDDLDDIVFVEDDGLQDFERLRKIGTRLTAAGLYDEAAYCLESALKIEAHSELFLFGFVFSLSTYYVKVEDFTKAMLYAILGKEMLTVNGVFHVRAAYCAEALDEHSLKSHFAFEALLAGMLASAEKYLDAVPNKISSFEDYWKNISRVLRDVSFEAGNDELQETQKVKDTLKLFISLIETLQLQIKLFEKMKNFNKAHVYSLLVLAMDPMNNQAHIFRMDTLLALKEKESALNACNEATLLLPNDATIKGYGSRFNPKKTKTKPKKK